MSVTMTDPRLSVLSNGQGYASPDATTAALELLRAWKSAGVHLTWDHVDAAARIVGAKADLLRMVIADAADAATGRKYR